MRRRLLLVIAPAALLTLAVIAIGVGRVSRAVVRPVVEGSALVILDAVSADLETVVEDPAAVRERLERWLTQPQRSAMLVAEDGRPWAVAGTVDDPAALAADGAELLGEAPRCAAVTGFGPIHARLIAARRVDPHRTLVYEHRLHGLWTPFTIAGIAVAASVVLLALAFSVALAGSLHRPLVRRLGTIQRALNDYAAGNTARRIATGEQPADEFDEVAAAFNHMADRIAELERQRDQQLEAERTLLADLAHDINTPITVLRGYAETLVDRGSRLEEGARQHVSTEILGQALYVQAIVEDLLTMASARNAQLTVAPQQVCLDSLFDTIIDAFEPLAEGHGRTILGDAGGIQLWADPVRLRQLLTNLVRNALVHADGATLIELGAREQDGGALLWVADDGPGVAAEDQPRLFERRSAGASRCDGGWGLGLAIVRTLAELHGGWAAYRAQNHGARFEVWLPGASRAVAGTAAEETP